MFGGRSGNPSVSHQRQSLGYGKGHQIDNYQGDLSTQVPYSTMCSMGVVIPKDGLEVFRGRAMRERCGQPQGEFCEFIH